MLDVLYTGGLFHTMDPSRPVATSMAVHAGRIVAMDAELSSAVFREVVDLKGAAVVPGFHDAHLHLSMLGEALGHVDVRPSAVRTLEELLAAVASAARAAAPGAWIVGEGYDQNYLGDRHPTAEELDAVSYGHPVYLVHASHHMGVANTAAFELAGYPERRGLVAPEGGAVPTDGDGRAVGLLVETAKDLVLSALPAKSVEDIAGFVRAGSEALLPLGITSATEPGIGAPDHIGHSLQDLAGFQLAQESGRLKVRTTVMPYLTALHELGAERHAGHALFGLDLGLRSGFGNDTLRIGPTKVLSDGSLIGRSAFMCCDYAAEPGERGLLQFSEGLLRERLIGAHLAGWQLAIHAIGDAALDLMLDVIEEAQALLPRPDARHRIEHASVASDAQIERMARLGVVPVPQGRFVYELGEGVHRALGTERSALAYRVRSFLDAGIDIPASTDAPVVQADPIANIDALVNRLTHTGEVFGEAERITAEQAVRAYTVGSARAVHQEGFKGSLSRGKLADFVTLSEDLLAVPAHAIKDVAVTATVLGGELAAGAL
ncbi:MAG: amidohydrolase [Arthrobacter sp.]|jgi:predicted amidohydrolase YtcJ|nr:amidohydrolase [Arthrobacter sp.]